MLFSNFHLRRLPILNSGEVSLDKVSESISQAIERLSFLPFLVRILNLLKFAKLIANHLKPNFRSQVQKPETSEVHWVSASLNPLGNLNGPKIRRPHSLS
jgi:hypothetical protein